MIGGIAGKEGVQRSPRVFDEVPWALSAAPPIGNAAALPCSWGAAFCLASREFSPSFYSGVLEVS